jgi:transcriptional regulator with XRE-family HTH domain
METLGERIKRIRKSINLTQKELAEKAGITQSALVAIEKGKTRNIFLEVAKGIARSLNVSFDYLYDMDEAKRIDRFLENIKQLEDQLETEKRLNKLMLEDKAFDRVKNMNLEKLNSIVGIFRYFEIVDLDLLTRLNPEYAIPQITAPNFKLSFVEEFVREYGDQSLTEIQKYIDLDKYIASDIDAGSPIKEQYIEFIKRTRLQQGI